MFLIIVFIIIIGCVLLNNCITTYDEKLETKEPLIRMDVFWRYARYIFMVPISALVSVFIGRVVMFIINWMFSSAFNARNANEQRIIFELNKIPYVGEFILFSVQIAILAYALYVMIPILNKEKKLQVSLGILILINSARMFMPYMITNVMNYQFVVANILFSIAALYFIANPQKIGI